MRFLLRMAKGAGKFLAGAALAVAVFLAGTYFHVRGALPPYSGHFDAAGLKAPVEIQRDKNAIPHIVAGSIEDAAFALAQTILNTATVIEFDFAVIDAELPQPILGRIIDAVSRKLLDVPTLGRLRPEVRLGHLGRGGAAQGAAQLRIYRRHYSRDLVDMELY